MTEPLATGATVAAALALARTPDQRIDLRALLCWVLDQPLSWLLTHDRQELSEQARQRLNAAWTARCAGQPVAYLTGEREFHGLPFLVGPGALIPRPDTELLVDLILQACPPDQPATLLDLGTGSGAIALSVAARRPALRVTATDRMPAALDWARRNARQLAVDDRVELLSGRWLDAVAGRQFDLIASNPPYIAANDPHLQQGDLRFEPRTALVAGTDGLDDLREIARTAPGHLHPGGLLLLEHGYDQGPAVRELLAQAGLVDVATHRDLGQHERVTLGYQGGPR